MTPDQTKLAIEREYEHLIDRSIAGEISPGAPRRVIESRAREAARHHGIPEAWWNFMPASVRDGNSP